MQYGFQRLVLLNSAGYSRAELPLDAAVSLVAPNNTGKTSLINALQFLLIIDKRRMDFGAHDVDVSRRFYFPHNSAYILLEASLPNTGTVVLGCVGKGVSHDYEYFAYKGELHTEDYRLPDGSQVQQPQLKAHMASLGKLVFSYSSSDFAAALYGNRRKQLDQEPDLTVFKLEHPSHADAFQRVLTRTLRLDKLRSGEVKDYLLAIFRRDLPDHNIDFKAEWDKAFAEVNADRAQYQATLRQKSAIQAMENLQAKRLELRGKLLHFRPLIEQRLQDWEAHYHDQRNTLLDMIANIGELESKLLSRDRQLTEQKSDANRQRMRLGEFQQRQERLAMEFALVENRRILDASLIEERHLLETQTALVQNASSRGVDAIRRDREGVERERDQSQRELASLANNLYLHLKSMLSPDQLDTLNRTLNRQAMTIPVGEFPIDSVVLRQWLDSTQTATAIELSRHSGMDRRNPDCRDANDLCHPWSLGSGDPCRNDELFLNLMAVNQSAHSGWLELPGLGLSLAGLSPQHTQRSQSEIQQRLKELSQQAEDLERQMLAALDLDAARREKSRLQASVREIEEQVKRFDEFQALKANETARTAEMAELTVALSTIETELGNSLMAAQRLRLEDRELQGKLDRLEGDHKTVTRLRENRRDVAPVFSSLAELPYQTWLGAADCPLDKLAGVLESYQSDCVDLLQLDRDMETRLAQLHAGGLTKFQFLSGSEGEINRIIEFAAHLAQEEQALDRKSRSAVVNVTACLRELRDGLVTFKSKMRDFNRLINRRQLSDLSVFRVEPVDESSLVESIEQLISTAEQAESGETFDLFNHASVLDDATLNRAKTLLIHEGEVRGCLRVEHFFRLEFIVGKAGRKEESFSDIDSAASNGTVLMAKLVTGLALLHLMQDKRYNVQLVCYLDEASSLDQRNQRNLIETAQDFGYALIFASPTPLITARYCVPIGSHDGHNHINRKSWQILEPLDEINGAGKD